MVARAMSLRPAVFCAIRPLPAAQQLAISVDTLVEDVHFSANTPVAALGYKCVAVNLSDMAAMGATPLALQCAWSDPHNDPSWQEALQRAITHAAGQVPMTAGLAMVAAPKRQISIQIMGTLAPGEALTRDGARAGDQLWVSGTLGDAGGGLALSQGRLRATQRDDHDYLLTRLHRPTARLALGHALRGIASAAIDLSDGIAGDASHLATRSKVEIRIFPHLLPLSAALLRVAGETQARQLALGAGEDYELAFSAPAHRARQVQRAAQLCQLPVHCIGEVVCGNSLILLDEQMHEQALPAAFDHFAGQHMSNGTDSGPGQDSGQGTNQGASQGSGESSGSDKNDEDSSR